MSLLSLLAVLALASTGCTRKGSATSTSMSVHFIDVGQGDAILIDCGTTEVLIDGGGSNSNVISYLNNYVDGPLEVVVATHPHADHIGGLINVLESFNVEEVWKNGEESTSQTYTIFNNVINSKAGTIRQLLRGETLDVATTSSYLDLAFSVLNPSDTLAKNVNNNSVVLEFTYGDTKFLFEGDAEQEAEASMIEAGVLSDIDILKIGHHGSRTASSSPFLAAATPEVAIYMAGTGNTYGHPHTKTLTAVSVIGATIYGTDVNGTIVISTDGQTYSVTTAK